MIDTFFDERVMLHCGDCREVLAMLPECSIDSCVTDPPYHLTSIVKRFGAENAAPAQFGTDGRYARASAGFMGKQWDGGEIAFDPATWIAVYRVLKPGAHLLAMGSTRGYHRMACAIEDAGFEIRDSLMWVYGTGFPKSHNQKGDWDGWGTALKPAFEPIVLARKPLSEGTVAANVLRWRTGALNIDACRIDNNGEQIPTFKTEGGQKFEVGCRDQGVARTGETRSNGRWPANVVHDGSDEVIGAFPTSKDGVAVGRNKSRGSASGNVVYGDRNVDTKDVGYGGGGSAARFFYTAKADADDRRGSKHPTVKPLDLMQWLVRMVTPPGGTVLDPFAGTGTTGEAACREGMHAVLIEREEEYQSDIRRRMKLAFAGPDERHREMIKASGRTESPGPLFDRKYNGADDFANSYGECLREVRERKANGGPGREPK